MGPGAAPSVGPVTAIGDWRLACRESFRELAVRRVAASPESIGGEGEELVPNAALLHNRCVFPAVPETGKRWKAGRPAGALPG